MGAICGRPNVVSSCPEPVVESEEKEYQSSSAVDKRIITVLQAKKKEHDAAGSTIKSFDKFIMKFGMIENSFLALRETYNKYKDAEVDGLKRGDLLAAMKELGAGEISESELEDIFFESDMRRDQSLDFNEFVVSLALGYLLGVVPNITNRASCDVKPVENEMKNDNLNLAKAFNVVVDAYIFFDKDASGTIRWDELTMIWEGKNAADKNSKFLNQERWKELDWDQNGTITFQEFLLAFQSWIGVEAEEDE